MGDLGTQGSRRGRGDAELGRQGRNAQLAISHSQFFILNSSFPIPPFQITIWIS